MGLKIIKANEPIRVERLNVCIYGAPGTGKTTAAFTSESPLLFDFDEGAHRAKNRQDTVQIAKWSDIDTIRAADLQCYKTIVVDTAGRALDMLAIDIIECNHKHGSGGALNLKGFGVLKSRFTSWLKMINSFGLDVILIAHMDEQRSNEEIIERLDVQGGSKNEIYKSVDAMGRIILDKQIGRILDFTPTSAAFGKNPGGFEPLNVPDVERNPHFMAEIITKTKERLNELTEAQQETMRQINEWREKTSQIVSVDEINSLIPKVKECPTPVQLVLSDRAKHLGFQFDKKTNKYIEPEKADV